MYPYVVDNRQHCAGSVQQMLARSCTSCRTVRERLRPEPADVSSSCQAVLSRPPAPAGSPGGRHSLLV